MRLEQTGRQVKSVRTAMKIVEHLQEHDGATLTEICEHFEFARSTGHSYLSTLESMEYVTKTGEKYKLGLKFLSHGIAAKNSVSIAKLAEPILEDIAEETGGAAWLVVEEHGRSVFLDNAITDDAVRTYGRISKRMPLHTHAGGKAILAHMDEVDRRSVVDKYGLPAKTEQTITDIGRLEAELDTIRRLGQATDEHEAALGVSSVAAPILLDGDILGAVQITSLASRLDDETFEEELPAIVRKAADAITEQYSNISS